MLFPVGARWKTATRKFLAHHLPASYLLMNKESSIAAPSRLAVAYRAVGDLIPDPRRGADRDLVAGE